VDFGSHLAIWYPQDRETHQPFLPADIEAAVAASHGGPVSIVSQYGRYVVMDADLYRGSTEATPSDMADSVAAIKRSLAQAAAGHARDVDEVFDALKSRYGG
jgi:hypothetical protein